MFPARLPIGQDDPTVFLTPPILLISATIPVLPPPLEYRQTLLQAV